MFLLTNEGSNIENSMNSLLACAHVISAIILDFLEVFPSSLSHPRNGSGDELILSAPIAEDTTSFFYLRNYYFKSYPRQAR